MKAPQHWSAELRKAFETPISQEAIKAARAAGDAHYLANEAIRKFRLLETRYGDDVPLHYVGLMLCMEIFAGFNAARPKNKARVRTLLADAELIYMVTARVALMKSQGKRYGILKACEGIILKYPKRYATTVTALIRLAMIHIMLRRLTRLSPSN